MAVVMDLLRDLLDFRKKLTVIGIMGHTHGVTSAMRPPIKPAMKMYHRLRLCCCGSSSKAFISASQFSYQLSVLTPDMLTPGSMRPSADCSESVISAIALAALSRASFFSSSSFLASSLTASVTGDLPLNE